jgi:hypothetical protein
MKMTMKKFKGAFKNVLLTPNLAAFLSHGQLSVCVL